MTIFFTADTHFGHASIIRLAGRPFASVEEMDEALIEGWNDVVGPGDTVYHLGDFAYRAAACPDHYRARLNGEIHLVVGNHDGPTVREWAHLFASVAHITVIHPDRQRVVLCHYPMREWPGAFHGAWHLFGHVHTGYDNAPWGYSMDVGVDSHAYRPIALEQVAAVMRERDNPFVGDRRTVRPKLGLGDRS